MAGGCIVAAGCATSAGRHPTRPYAAERAATGAGATGSGLSVPLATAGSPFQAHAGRQQRQLQQRCSQQQRRQHRVLLPRCRAAASGGGSGSRHAAARSSGPTVISRKAYDVAVLGAGAIGLLAARELAVAGMKVLVIHDYGLEMSVAPWRQALRPLPIVCTDTHLTYLAATGTEMWLGACSSWLGVPRERLLLQGGALMFATTTDEPALEDLDAMQAAAKEAGVRYSLPVPQELHLPYPHLSFRRGCSIMRVPSGGAAAAGMALEAAEAAAVRAGVEVRRTSLIGWQDRGGYFAIRHADASMARAREEMQDEAGQLLLAPESWAARSAALFGLRMEPRPPSNTPSSATSPSGSSRSGSASGYPSGYSSGYPSGGGGGSGGGGSPSGPPSSSSSPSGYSSSYSSGYPGSAGGGGKGGPGAGSGVGSRLLLSGAWAAGGTPSLPGQRPLAVCLDRRNWLTDETTLSGGLAAVPSDWGGDEGLEARQLPRDGVRVEVAASGRGGGLQVVSAAALEAQQQEKRRKEEEREKGRRSGGGTREEREWEEREWEEGRGGGGGGGRGGGAGGESMEEMVVAAMNAARAAAELEGDPLALKIMEKQLQQFVKRLRPAAGLDDGGAAADEEEEERGGRGRRRGEREEESGGGGGRRRGEREAFVPPPAPPLMARDGMGGRRLLVTETADGFPVVGSHPGFEPGHVTVCISGCGGPHGMVDDFALAPVLAAEAAALVLGQVNASSGRTRELDLARADPGRDAVGGQAAGMEVDPWDVHFLSRLRAGLAQDQAALRALDEGGQLLF